MAVWCPLQRRREKEIEGELALALIVIALAHTASPDPEGLSRAYHVQPMQSEAWLRAAELAGYIKAEPATLQTIAQIGLGVVHAERDGVGVVDR